MRLIDFIPALLPALTLAVACNGGPDTGTDLDGPTDTGDLTDTGDTEGPTEPEGIVCDGELLPVIPDVVVVTDMGVCCGASLDAMVDGTGIDDEGLHNCGDGDGWKSDGVTSGALTFDLGDVYALDTVTIWNSGQLGGDRGVKNLAIFTSVDGAAYVPLAQAPTSLEAAVGCPVAPSEYPFDRTEARFVRFDVGSGHGADTVNVGLLEVQFSGQVCE